MSFSAPEQEEPKKWIYSIKQHEGNTYKVFENEVCVAICPSKEKALQVKDALIIAISNDDIEVEDGGEVIGEEYEGESNAKLILDKLTKLGITSGTSWSVKGLQDNMLDQNAYGEYIKECMKNEKAIPRSMIHPYTQAVWDENKEEF